VNQQSLHTYLQMFWKNYHLDTSLNPEKFHFRTTLGPRVRFRLNEVSRKPVQNSSLQLESLHSASCKCPAAVSKHRVAWAAFWSRTGASNRERWQKSYRRTQTCLIVYLLLVQSPVFEARQTVFPCIFHLDLS